MNEKHVCGVISGEKLVITSLPSEPGRLGWVLPCEVFKGRPVLLGVHCDNIEDTSMVDVLSGKSPYFKVATSLLKVWESLCPCMRGSCFGQWLIKVTNEPGDLMFADGCTYEADEF